MAGPIRSVVPEGTRNTIDDVLAVAQNRGLDRMRGLGEALARGRAQQAENERMAFQQERARKQDESSALQGITQALDAGVPFDAAISAFPSVAANQIPFLSHYAKERKKELSEQQKDRELNREASLNAQAQNFVPFAAQTVRAANEGLVPPEAIAGTFEGIPPQYQGRVSALANVGARGLQAEKAIGDRDAKEAARIRLNETVASERRAEGRVIRAENRAQERKLADEASNAVSEMFVGVQAQAINPQTQTRVIDDVLTRFGPELGSEILNRASHKAVQSAVLKRHGILTTETDTDKLARTYEDMGHSKNDAMLLAHKRAKMDPATGLALYDPTGIQMDARIALVDLLDMSGELETYAQMAASEAKDGGYVGPVRGADGVRRVARFFNKDTRGAAAYETFSRLFVSRVLKSIQGSRPSDFDLRFYMELLPLMTELEIDANGELSPAVKMRINIMEEMLEKQKWAPFNKELQKEARKQRAIPWTVEEKRMQANMKLFAEEKINYKEFHDAIAPARAVGSGRSHLGNQSFKAYDPDVLSVVDSIP